MTTWRLVALVSYALACVICGIRSSIIVTRMVSAVNDRLSQNQRFSPNWWYYGKLRRLIQSYRSMYPTGPLIRQLRTVVVAMLLAFLAASVAILSS
jgi:hypothetical protein